jgi:H+/Cl- antiporter ClcA
MTFIFKIILIGLITGALSGIFSTLFLNSLFFVTKLRISSPIIILLLPLFGLCSVFFLKRTPKYIDISIKDIKDNIVNKENSLSLLTAPFIFITSIGTHLFGGSAGREGVGVLMGASLSSLFKKIFVLKDKDLGTLLLYCGVASGFSSIFGAPIAAIFFAYEIDRFKKIKDFPTFLIVISGSLSAYFTTMLLRLGHEIPQLSFTFSLETISYILISGVVCGLGALAYYYSITLYKKTNDIIFKNQYFKYFFGSLLIITIIFLLNAFDYTGIGTTYINNTFLEKRSFYDFLMKFILTTLTLGIGYKGGEVTPLLFMGSSLSNSILTQLGFGNYALSSALGMFAFFGAATATPLTSAFMALDLFGPELAIVCLPTCYIARIIMRKKSLY